MISPIWNGGGDGGGDGGDGDGDGGDGDGIGDSVALPCCGDGGDGDPHGVVLWLIGQSIQTSPAGEREPVLIKSLWIFKKWDEMLCYTPHRVVRVCLHRCEKKEFS